MTPEQRQIRELAREFAEGELRPHAEEWDGLGMDAATYLIALEEIARGDASVAVAMSVHNSLPTQMILARGTDEQKERFLRPMARGEWLGAFALSEADAGSDAAGMSAQAVKTDGGWVLNGSKAWITNGGFGDVVVAMCRTDAPGDRRGAKGIGAFILRTDAEGYAVGKKEDKMGQRASETVGIAFRDLFVPDDQVLGDPSQGFIYALQGLDNGRLGIAAMAIGIAQAALDHALAYAGERRQFGTAIRDFQGMQFKLADMATRIEAARGLLYRAAAAKDAGEPVTRLASMAKLFASEAAMWVTTQAVQVFGGYGYVKEYPVEKLFRDAKVTEIYEGTSEIQRVVIARDLYR